MKKIVSLKKPAPSLFLVQLRTFQLHSSFYQIAITWIFIASCPMLEINFDTGFYLIKLFSTSGWESSTSGKIFRVLLTTLFAYHLLIGAGLASLLALELLSMPIQLLKFLTKRREYNEICIIIHLINRIAGWTVTIGIFGVSGIFICAMNVTIKYYGKYEIYIYLAFPLCAILMGLVAAVVLTCGARVKVLSTRLVQNSGQINICISIFRFKIKYQIRLNRATKAVAMQGGGVGEISETWILKLFSAWAEQTVAVLIAFK